MNIALEESPNQTFLRNDTDLLDQSTSRNNYNLYVDA